MTTSRREQLYALLPGFYRLRDAAQGEPLRALLAVMEEQLRAVEQDITTLHDNWFIETCEEWVVPYIGELLGVRSSLHPVNPGTYSQRAYVANTLAYRRRKGTAAVMEQLAQDVTGWPARAVEYFQRLAITQHLSHPRPGNVALASVRDSAPLELLGGPFDPVPHTVEVRRAESGRGRYNLPSVGLLLWRLEAYPVEEAPATPVAGVPGGFRFSQLGHDLPLFNPATAEADISHLASEENVAGPLRRRALDAELVARQQGLAPRSGYFDVDQPVFQVLRDGVPVPLSELAISNLAQWRVPPAGRVAVDPVLGRIAFPAEPGQRVTVSYHYGFSADVGGGMYDRSQEVRDGGTPVRVQGGGTKLQDALAAWVAAGRQPTVLEIADNEAYTVADVSVPGVAATAGVPSLEIRAADGKRPLLRLSAPWALTLAEASWLRLSGLLVSGQGLEVEATGDAVLELRHCTLVPGFSLGGDGQPVTPEALSVSSAGGAGRLELRLVRCISGRLSLPRSADATTVVVRDSILDGAGGAAHVLSAGTADLERTTVFGSTDVVVLEASDTLFTGAVTVQRLQLGCVRFSYVPPGSIVPRSYRCQPELASRGVPEAEQPAVWARLRPSFVSTRYGQPGYAQLEQGCPDALRRGASNESEMGVFQYLLQPQREANLRAALEEYQPVGLEAGIFYVT
ncbi:hypothetical protein [Myxococcus sp. RHSTA-1-4]|uniref:hypothetical protein n=1 Tax=Myxococcus sp. RHSTA-1-4 TaxID=2874601 RepID=UPI001CBE0378|nr:hypothetical protein [Myxococcus sp. RHSTA-1-4]MBZ4415599.1 hypothetical protein [Myxococcus sp. RHSTA-1-4]